MAAGSIPKPGSKYGPCMSACRHCDCKQYRKDAATICPLCKKPIGYDTSFYDDRGSISIDDFLRALVHAECSEIFSQERREVCGKMKLVMKLDSYGKPRAWGVGVTVEAARARADPELELYRKEKRDDGDLEMADAEYTESVKTLNEN
jgi:hypothetical protein